MKDTSGTLLTKLTSDTRKEHGAERKAYRAEGKSVSYS